MLRGDKGVFEFDSSREQMGWRRVVGDFGRTGPTLRPCRMNYDCRGNRGEATAIELLRVYYGG